MNESVVEIMKTQESKAMQISIRLKGSVYDRINIISTKTQRSMGFVIRDCVEAGLDRWEKSNSPFQRGTRVLRASREAKLAAAERKAVKP